MRFNLKSTLIITMLAAVGALAIRDYRDRQPLRLEPYSKKTRDDALKNGQCVLVTIYGNWDASTADALRWLPHEVTLRVRSRNMLALAADWSGPTLARTAHGNASHVSDLMQELGVESVPVLAFYDPRNPDSPTILRDQPDKASVLDAIDSCCK